jgi:hypothetical protein
MRTYTAFLVEITTQFLVLLFIRIIRIVHNSGLCGFHVCAALRPEPPTQPTLTRPPVTQFRHIAVFQGIKRSTVETMCIASFPKFPKPILVLVNEPLLPPPASHLQGATYRRLFERRSPPVALHGSTTAHGSTAWQHYCPWEYCMVALLPMGVLHCSTTAHGSTAL